MKPNPKLPQGRRVFKVDLPDETQKRITDQRSRVATFVPGSEAHRVATDVLLLLQDTAHVVTEAQDMLKAVRRSTGIA